jgi:sulfate permease, SulP family
MDARHVRRRARAEADGFRSAGRPGLLARTVPLSASVRGYRPPSAGRDLLAALTVAALAVPAAMGFAELAGLSPVNGLYGLLLPTVAYALLGSSRQLVVGPEGTLAAMAAATIIGGATAAASGTPAGIAATLALLMAACFVVARILRLAWIADYFSRPVLTGYIHGVAVVLILGQLGRMLGVEVEPRAPLPELVEVLKEVGSANPATVAVSACSLAVLVALRLWLPRVPGPLVIVVAGIAASTGLGLAADGVAVVGPVPSGLPSVQVPQMSLSQAIDLLPAALGLFLVCFADGILLARSYAGRHDEHIDGSQEMLALGAANAAAGLTQSMPIGASVSRTAVADSMGMRTQVGGLMAAGLIVLVLLFFTAPIADLPKAVLGATIVAAAWRLFDPSAWRALAATDSTELAIAAVAGAGVIVVGVLPAIAFAVGLSIVDVVRRSAHPHDAVLGWEPKLGRYADVAVHRRARQTPGVVVYRLDDRLFYANAGYFKGRVQEALRGADLPPHWFVLDAEGVTHVDSAGMDALTDVRRVLAGQGVTLVLARLKTPVRERLDAAGVTAAVGTERFYPTVRAAVAARTPSTPEIPA